MILNEIDIDIMNEAYFGKSPILKQCEGLLGKIIKNINENYSKNKKRTNKIINDLPEAIELNKLLAKQFKLKTCSINFYQSSGINQLIDPSMNAFIIPTNIGFISKKTNFIYVNIDELFIYSLKMNPGELMAILLHEIGHGLDVSLNSLVSRMVISPNIIQMIMSIGGSYIFQNSLVPKLLQDISKGITKATNSMPWLSNLMKSLTKLKIEYSRAINLVMGLPITGISIMQLPMSVITGLMPSGIAMYNMEVYADSFASAYGYSKDLSSAMNKVEHRKMFTVDSAVQKVPVVNFVTDFFHTSQQIMFTLADPHPKNSTRALNQLKKLKSDLNRQDFDPKDKKALLKDIQDMENYMEKVVLNPKTTDNQRNLVTFAFAQMNVEVFGGNFDIRNLFRDYNEV